MAQLETVPEYSMDSWVALWVTPLTYYFHLDRDLKVLDQVLHQAS